MDNTDIEIIENYQEKINTLNTKLNSVQSELIKAGCKIAKLDAENERYREIIKTLKDIKTDHEPYPSIILMNMCQVLDNIKESEDNKHDNLERTG